VEMNFRAFWDEKKIAVDKTLEGVFADHTSRLAEAIRYSLFSGGKRLRPLLAVAVHEALGGTLEKVVNSACAVELFHTASLILDDLPSMDNSDDRRGKPSCHKVFGESTAILAAVGLASKAFEILTGEFSLNKISSSIVLNIVQEAARRIGTCGVIGGQFYELEMNQNPADRDGLRDKLDYIVSNKTVPLFLLPATIGASLAGAKDDRLFDCLDYANHLGYALQISDDLLDRGESNQITFPRVFGIEESQRLLEEKTAGALAAIAGWGEEAWPLRELIRYVLNRALQKETA